MTDTRSRIPRAEKLLGHRDRYTLHLGRLQRAGVYPDKNWRAFLRLVTFEPRLMEVFDLRNYAEGAIPNTHEIDVMSSGERMVVNLALHLLNRYEHPTVDLSAMLDYLDDRYWRACQEAIKIYRTGKEPSSDGHD